MGLAERRAAKQFETHRLPALTSEIHAAAGFEVPLEIHWDAMATEGNSHLFEETWPQVYFQPLIAAFKQVASDDMGKEALKGALKKVVVHNTADISYAGRMVTFASGVLTIDHAPTTNAHQVDDRTRAIREVLEKSL
ncbi:hypothetical protein ACLESD_02200 [Pyxidicoccus sp. 3LFB2]